MKRTFCDVCKKELTRNMATDYLFVRSGVFSAEVKVMKDGDMIGDLCYDCLIKMLTAKPKRKYARKPTALPAMTEAAVPDVPPMPAALESRGAPSVSAVSIPLPLSSATRSILTVDDETGLLPSPLKKKRARQPKIEPFVGKPDISTFKFWVAHDDEPHKVEMGNMAMVDDNLKDAVTALLLACGVDKEYVEKAPDSEGKRELLAILKGKEK